MDLPSLVDVVMGYAGYAVAVMTGALLTSAIQFIQGVAKGITARLWGKTVEEVGEKVGAGYDRLSGDVLEDVMPRQNPYKTIGKRGAKHLDKDDDRGWS